MAKPLPAWFFLAISLILIGIAQLPLIRVGLGIDEDFSLSYLTVVVIMIGGLMSGLTAMILLVRRVHQISTDQLSITPADSAKSEQNQKTLSLLFAASGLLLYSGIPLLNFLVAYWLWTKYRHTNTVLEVWGRDVLNFQITIYLYLLLSLFMVFAFIGIFSTPAILLLHLLVTILSIIFVAFDKPFNFPANIPIIQSRQAKG